MNKKGDATVLETMNLFQVIGGIFFFAMMMFALNQYYGAGSKGYALSLSQQLKLGSNLVKNIDSDSGIVYSVNSGVYLTEDNLDIKKTKAGIFDNLNGNKLIIVERKNNVFNIYEEEIDDK